MNFEKYLNHFQPTTIFYLFLIFLFPEYCYSQLDGDLNTSINHIYPDECYVHNKLGGHVFDITQPPFNARGDGITDDSDPLIAAYDTVVSYLRRYGTLEHQASFFIYLPNGTYKVSKTIIYSGDPWIRSNGQEEISQIRFVGQNRDSTIIQLVDSCPAFDTLNPVISYGKVAANNWPGINVFRNITINTGKGNPGAIGLDYVGANTAEVRNVTIKSEDGKGKIGLFIRMLPTQGFYTNITVDGFDHGIRVMPSHATNPTFEHITLKNQKVSAFRIDEAQASVRDLKSINSVPAIEVTSNISHLVLIDSKLMNGADSVSAIVLPDSCLSFFGRNIEVEGYNCGIKRGDIIEENSDIVEFVAGTPRALFSGVSMQSLNLPIKNTPIVPIYPPEDWISVESMGAIGDSVHDDTEAIQNAMNSGKSVVFFNGQGLYVISNTITVPAGVKRINFMYSRLRYENPLGDSDNAAFQINENSTDPLLIENIYNLRDNVRNAFLFDHAVSRTLVLQNLFLGLRTTCYKYTGNSHDTELYIENCRDILSVLDDYSDLHIWARWINNETNYEANFYNDGNIFWVLGYKCERGHTNFKTLNGGQTEVLGGIINQYGSGWPTSDPMLEVINSSCSFIGSTSGPNDQNRQFEIIFKETRNINSGTLTNFLSRTDFPIRKDNLIHVPLIVTDFTTSWENEILKSNNLLSVFPNPFKNKTNILLCLEDENEISIKVYDITGREICTLVNKQNLIGNYYIIWETQDLPLGFYLVKLQLGSKNYIIKKVVKQN